MNKWINIKDSKPVHGETVLVVNSNGFVSQAEYREPSQEFFEPYFGQEEMDAFKDVTHWMPMPEPPK